ncbi:hypothetical protein RRG08_027628 [Elysia crispata]|uniref:Uncharacterized protein n=1 Tax=Elysia crispata TaxID=231223 RepID=A0AAE1E6A7_9GAST|nr:hypothetical protein RRG08_027628 [Elysia crispata]
MDSGGIIHQLCHQLSSVIGSLGPSVVFGYKGVLLIFAFSWPMRPRVREEEERHQKNLNENEQLKKQIAETARQFNECLDRMLHTPVTSFITSLATARPLWFIMLFGLWPLLFPLQVSNVEEKLYGEKYVWFSIGWYLDNW